MEERTLIASITFKVREASVEDCDRANQPHGRLEVIDSDGDRLAWASSIDEARQAVTSLIDWDAELHEEATTYSDVIRLINRDLRRLRRGPATKNKRQRILVLQNILDRATANNAGIRSIDESGD